MASQQTPSGAMAADSGTVKRKGRKSAAKSQQRESESVNYFNLNEVLSSQQGREAVLKQLLTSGKVYLN